MTLRRVKTVLSAYLCSFALIATSVPSVSLAATTAPNDGKTTTPIKHVIIIIGENRSFEHLFATYVPPKGTIDNLFSKGIVKADGSPGAHFSLAQQYSAVDEGNAKTEGTYSIAPGGKKLYTSGANNMPPIMTGKANISAPYSTLAEAKAKGTGLEPADAVLLTTGGTGLPKLSIDTRHPNATDPKNGPFPLSPSIGYDAYAASPTHRFYQMFQQMDCAAAHATAANPSGCLNDLFPWVSATIDGGNWASTQPAGFNDRTMGEGSTPMGFYNVQQGDMPYFKRLSDEYALGDNYHQPGRGGTGSNSLYLGFAANMYYTDDQGNIVTPPAHEIEDPNPQPKTNNYYANDGFGNYTNCSDRSQPGVAGILDYLAALSYKPKSNCAFGHYYMLNDAAPGFKADGSLSAPAKNRLAPQSQRSIANTLDEANVSWTYYSEGWSDLVAGKTASFDTSTCNPFLFQIYVMTNASRRKNHLKDTSDLYSDLAKGELPAVSWVKPSNLNDGHPASSKYDLFEAFVKKIIDELQAKPALWATTAVMITNDEGGGYYDSGFIQTLDFFGDGTRVPMIVVSPYSRGVGVVHSYGDHVSFIKFVNANWKLKPIAANTRDNLPNPKVSTKNPYVPTNMPAIDDMMSYFDFTKKPD